MNRQSDPLDTYTPEETQRRVEASLRAAFKMGPMPRSGPKAKGETAAKPAKKKGG